MVRMRMRGHRGQHNNLRGVMARREGGHPRSIVKPKKMMAVATGLSGRRKPTYSQRVKSPPKVQEKAPCREHKENGGRRYQCRRYLAPEWEAMEIHHYG